MLNKKVGDVAVVLLSHEYGKAIFEHCLVHGVVSPLPPRGEKNSKKSLLMCILKEVGRRIALLILK